jgi:hypothetical protein
LQAAARKHQGGLAAPLSATRRTEALLLRCLKISSQLERDLSSFVLRFLTTELMMSSRVWYALGLVIVALLPATGLRSNLSNSLLSETNADANASRKLPDLSAPRTEGNAR